MFVPIRLYNSKTRFLYIYQNSRSWDSEKNENRTTRRCLGKLDPVSGEILANPGRGRPRKAANAPERPEAEPETLPPEADPDPIPAPDPEPAGPPTSDQEVILTKEELKQMQDRIALQENLCRRLMAENNELRQMLLQLTQRLDFSIQSFSEEVRYCQEMLEHL